METTSSLPGTPFSEANPSWTGTAVKPLVLSASSIDYKSDENKRMAEQTPRRLGFFSLIGPVDRREREFRDQDYSALCRLSQPYYRSPASLPHNGLNLNRPDGLAGIRQCKMSGRGQNDGLIPILQWILAHRNDFQREINVHKVKVVGQRSLVRQVGLGLQHPSRHERGWLMAACKFKDIVYITHFDTDDDLKGRNEYADRDDQRSWKKMFLNLMTSERQSAPRDLNINDAFKVVMRYEFGSTIGFLYDAKVDGYDEYFGSRDDVPSNAYNCNLVRRPKIPRHEKELRENKYGDWWQIAHFTGDRGVIVGYRTEGGYVTSCKAVEKAELVKHGSFDPAAVVGCVSEFLKKLCEEVVLKECHEAQYLLRYEPLWYGTIKIAEIKQDSEYRVLPQWFTDGMSAGQEVDAAPVVVKREDQIGAISDELAAVKFSATKKEPFE